MESERRDDLPEEGGYPRHPESRDGEEAHEAVHEAMHRGGSGPHDHRGDHGRHAGHSVAMFRDRFWWSLILTLPTLVWGPQIQEWLGYTAPVLPGSEWIAPLFGTLVFLYGGRVFLQGAWRELKDRLPGMMTLISLAILVAFGYSLAVTAGFPGRPLWWELATLVTIMLLGHWIEMRSITQAHGALRELAKLMPSTALRITSKHARASEAGGAAAAEETEQVPTLRDGDLGRERAAAPAGAGLNRFSEDELAWPFFRRPARARRSRGQVAPTRRGRSLDARKPGAKRRAGSAPER